MQQQQNSQQQPSINLGNRPQMFAQAAVDAAKAAGRICDWELNCYTDLIKKIADPEAFQPFSEKHTRRKTEIESKANGTHIPQFAANAGAPGEGATKWLDHPVGHLLRSAFLAIV